MTTPSRFVTAATAAAILWMFNLATRMLARSLNMPEPLVHSTGVFRHVERTRQHPGCQIEHP